jgi:hypothetical protein
MAYENIQDIAGLSEQLANLPSVTDQISPSGAAAQQSLQQQRASRQAYLNMLLDYFKQVQNQNLQGEQFNQTLGWEKQKYNQDLAFKQWLYKLQQDLEKQKLEEQKRLTNNQLMGLGPTAAGGGFGAPIGTVVNPNSLNTPSPQLQQMYDSMVLESASNQQAQNANTANWNTWFNNWQQQGMSPANILNNQQTVEQLNQSKPYLRTSGFELYPYGGK